MQSLQKTSAKVISEQFQLLPSGLQRELLSLTIEELKKELNKSLLSKLYSEIQANYTDIILLYQEKIKEGKDCSDIVKEIKNKFKHLDNIVIESAIESAVAISNYYYQQFVLILP